MAVISAVVVGVIGWGTVVLRAHESGEGLWATMKGTGVWALVVTAVFAAMGWLAGRSMDRDTRKRPPEDTYWKTDREGLTIGDDAGGRRTIPWTDVRSAVVQIRSRQYSTGSGDYEYSYLINTKQEHIAAKCEDLFLCASIWQHLRRLGKAEAPSALPPGVRRLWAQTSGKMVWVGSRTKHYVMVLLFSVLGIMAVHQALTGGFRLPYHGLAIGLWIALILPGVVTTMFRTADRVDCYDDHFDARLIGRTVSVQWDQVKSVSWSTTPPTATSDRCLSIITMDTGRNVLIPLRPKQEVSVALIYRMVVRLRSLGYSISTP